MVNRYTCKKIAVYSKILPLKKAGTGVENIDDEIPDEGERIILNSIAVENETSSLAYARIGKQTPNGYLIWEEQKNLPADEVAHSQEEHLIAHGEHFRAKVNGGAANDKIRVHLDGWILYGV